ncbi:COQ9 family protein [Paracoccus sediminicola]|uniref:COQ9 family protein n=1 Tax=Paracoccus sediminicola TaxID=3017783 RepID=UPI0022F0E267|nr:COQ9 family protein [Paracoccus sediminicola]WBU57162.1 COQ9 family protein [Paracoccus sediminicola]
MTDTRDRLAEAAITHVPFDGMNIKAVRAGARDLGLSPDIAEAFFPGGGADLAGWLHRRGDSKLADWLETAPGGKIRDRIADAIMFRLEATDKEMVRAASSVMALPQNQPLAARLVWETADTIWDGLGDTSRDVNWYSKRATLSAVHSACVLYWLGDNSEGYADTRAFIDRRIDGVMRFEKLKASARKIPGATMLADLATGWIRAPKSADEGGQA